MILNHLPPIEVVTKGHTAEEFQNFIDQAVEAPPEQLYVQFQEGIPAWIGPEPIEGCELVEGLSLEFLVAHLRTPEGEWIPRPPPPPPTEAELAELARVEAEAQAKAEADWKRWVEQEIARRAQPDMLQYMMGSITQEELRAREAVIRTDVESGN